MAKESTVFTAPWYPWYVRDVLTSERVDLLSLAEEGAYRRALDRAWMVGSIPANPKECAAVIGNKCTVKIAERVLTMFVEMPSRPDRMINLKLEKVRKEQKQKYKKRSKAGKENAIKGWKQRASANGNGMPTARHSETDTEVYKEKEIREAALPQTEPEPMPVDDRINHPAIVAIHAAVGIYPPREIWNDMIERMGVDVDIGKLKTTYAKWRARGYNKTNYDGFVDWYTNGIPEQGKKQNGSNQRDQGTSGNRATTTDRLAATADIISQYPSEAELGRQR